MEQRLDRTRHGRWASRPYLLWSPSRRPLRLDYLSELQELLCLERSGEQIARPPSRAELPPREPGLREAGPTLKISPSSLSSVPLDEHVRGSGKTRKSPASACRTRPPHPSTPSLPSLQAHATIEPLPAFRARNVLSLPRSQLRPTSPPPPRKDDVAA